MSNIPSNASAPISLESELAILRADNARLKANEAKRTTLTMKVSEKGAMSLYGMGRFPVTLYAQQWEKVLGHSAEITAFLTANAAKLTTKE